MRIVIRCVCVFKHLQLQIVEGLRQLFLGAVFPSLIIEYQKDFFCVVESNYCRSDDYVVCDDNLIAYTAYCGNNAFITQECRAR